jgi:myo-inositol 2-dehydrogenase/D-chiro-inositol 1-dehydrogenase
MVGQVLRYIEPFQSIRRWTREGRFGRPVHGFVQRIGAAGMFAGHPWRSSNELCGGFLFEVSVHELDFLRTILGEPAEVYAVRQKVRRADYDAEDIISVMVRFCSGASAHYDAGTAWGQRAYRFNLCYEEASLVSEQANNPAALSALSADPEPRQIALDPIERRPHVASQMREWLEALRDARPVPIPGEEGREAVRLAEAAYRSADSGCAVQLPEKG